MSFLDIFETQVLLFSLILSVIIKSRVHILSSVFLLTIGCVMFSGPYIVFSFLFFVLSLLVFNVLFRLIQKYSLKEAIKIVIVSNVFFRVIHIYSLKEAIKNFKKIDRKSNLSINKALKIIDKYIYLMLTLIGVIVFLFFNNYQFIQIPLAIFVILFVLMIMGNYYIKKEEQNITKVAENTLSTFFNMVLIFSISLSAVVLVYSFESISKSYVAAIIVAFIPTIPLMFLSNHVIEGIRYSFFTQKNRSQILIKNYYKYIILALIFIFVLSDIPLLVFLYGQHDYSKLFSWAAGFVPFIGWVSIRLLEKINIFKLESGLLTKKGADIELNKLLGKKEIFKY